jgi:beta-mannosidase
MYDPWPMIYSSIVDHYMEPKIAYYYIRRAYDPVLVSFEHTPDYIAAWVTNDSPEAVSGKLVVNHMNFNGEVLGEMSADVSIGPAESKRILNLTKLGILSLREEFLRATFAGRDATLLLAPERYLHLPHPGLQVRRTGDALEVKTDAFARQVTFEAEGALFEDNYFDMAPGQVRTVRILKAPLGRPITVRAINVQPVELPSN